MRGMIADAGPKDCGKLTNFMSTSIGFVLRSDRRACILQIPERGLRGHAAAMALHRQRTTRP